MGMKKRVEWLLPPSDYETHYQENWGVDPSPGIISKGATSAFGYTQSTETSGHAWPSAKRGTTDIGGNFSTSKVLGFWTNSDETIESQRNYGRKYIGKQFAYSPQSFINEALAAVAPSSDVNLMKLGSTAIARTIPTNPVADAGTFIGELKSGLPKLVGRELFKTKMKDYRKVGSEYLNVEFGWKPLISDLQKFGTAAIESEKIIEQLHRDSGKNVRRKFTFPDEITTTTFTSGTGQRAYTSGLSLYPALYNGSGRLTTITNTHVKTWFSGCYTYHLNLGTTLPDKIMRQAAEARKLFGVELTPATVWNLAPWSWAVDWEGNIGDVLHNVSRFAQDGLVLRYGYIMQQKTVVRNLSLSAGDVLTHQPTRVLQMAITTQSKVRRRATPFGFGFDMTALTGRQSAILGALGIARGPRHL